MDKHNLWGEVVSGGKVNTMDKPVKEKKDIDQATIKGDVYLMIKLEDGQSVDIFKQEVALIKAVFGRSNNDMTKHLNDHINRYGSIVGL